MEKIFRKLDEEEIKALIRFMRASEVSTSRQPPTKLDLPPVDMNLDGPGTYLSWSRQITCALAGKRLDGFLTGEKKEPKKDTAEWEDWKATHMLLYTWLLSSMVQSIAVTVDGIQSVQDIWTKLRRTYAGVENNMRVFQIKREIDAVIQGDRMIQEYAIDLERLWADYDHLLPRTSCKDLECKSGVIRSQERTMQFLGNLNPAFDQMRAVLLAQTKIPPLEEAIAAMMQEESRMKLHSEANGSAGMHSALVVSNSGMTRVQGETRSSGRDSQVLQLRRSRAPEQGLS